jgi:pimeloyl-ACP methyl ester carboxylesterase
VNAGGAPIGKGRSVRVILGALLVLLAGAILLVYLDYRNDLDAARGRAASGSRVADTPCGRIEYATTGRGSPVLVAHGAGGGFDQGLAIGGGLAERGFLVIAVSRFGYLRSPLPAEASAAAQADAYACLLDALKLPPAAVLAASAGAHSAVQFCLRHAGRCAALALLVPAFFDSRTPPVPGSALARPAIERMLTSDFAVWAALKLAPDRALEQLFGTPAADFSRASPEEQERVLGIVRTILPASERREGLRNDFAILTGTPRYALELLAVPTLVVAAEDDRFMIYESARALARRIPGARFLRVPSGGHLLAGHQREIISEIAAFLGQANSSLKPDGASARLPLPSSKDAP